MGPTFIDLFSGCGGLSLGLRQAGFEELFALEANSDAFATYKVNLHKSGQPIGWPTWLNYAANDVIKIAVEHRADLKKLRGTVDLIAGGPPCQGFSMNGRRDPADPRNRLVSAYLSIVRSVLPKVVLMENVRGFRSMVRRSGETHEAYVTARLEAMGYEVHAKLIDASDYGVPQRRTRFVLIAMLAGALPSVRPHERLSLDRILHLQELGLPTNRPVTIAEAIGDLTTFDKKLAQDQENEKTGFQSIVWNNPSEQGPYLKLMRQGTNLPPSCLRLPRHRKETSHRFTHIIATCTAGKAIGLDEKAAFGLKKRTTVLLDAEKPAPTIGTLPDDMVHPSEPRILTVRENARLQSFPDWFEFTGPYTSGGLRRRLACPRYTQVGNAVPPLLGLALGRVVATLLRDMGSYAFSHQPAIFKMFPEVDSQLGKVIHGEPRVPA